MTATVRTSANELVTMLGRWLIAATIVYATYYPSDSVDVERGGGLWFCGAAILVGVIGGWSGWGRSPSSAVSSGVSLAIDVLPWVLAIWMLVAAAATSPPGNLRMATNEAWVWFAAAAMLTGGRRLIDASAIGGLLVVAVAAAVALSAVALYQDRISLPRDRARYLADPDAVLAEAGVVAAAGSAERMAFENRLNDGGPTATFALANSLASPLVGGWAAAVGLLMSGWPFATGRPASPDGRSLVRLGAGVVAIALIAAALWSTGSRTALVVAMVVVSAVAAVRMRSTRVRGPVTPIKIAGLAAGASGLLLLAVVCFGKAEWIDQAPQSLAFRFRYWQTTASMAIDRPWFAAGPGNFQIVYDHYRDAAAGEQIADPHNFLMETLGSGGFVAAGLLIALAGVLVWYSGGGDQQSGETRPAPASGPAALASAGRGERDVLVGGVIGLVAVWLGGLLLGRLPDVLPQLWGVPLGLVAAGWTRRQIRDVADTAMLRRIVAIALLGLLLQLSISGGFTVPGVGVWVWVWVAALAAIGQPQPHTATRVSGPPPGFRPPPAAVSASIGVISLAGLVALRIVSIGPVTEARRWLTRAEVNQFEGRPRLVGEDIAAAVAADPWSAEATRWQVDHAKWTWIAARAAASDRQSATQSDRPDVASDRHRRQWRAAVDRVLMRGGEDAASARFLIESALHLYQQIGDRRELELAGELLDRSVRWSPAHEWHWAQAAEVQRALGHTDRATRSAATAWRLSRSGGNYQRWLERLMILPATEASAAASGVGPHEAWQRPASEVLANLLPRGDVR